MKTTEEVIMEFRERFTKDGFGNVINNVPNYGDNYHIMENLEQFIREALERVREETLKERSTKTVNIVHHELAGFGYKYCSGCGEELKANKPAK